MPTTVIISQGPTIADNNKYIKDIFEDKLNIKNCITIGSKIDDIRELIDMSTVLIEPTLFYIVEGDKLTIQAQNALLKLTEEVPLNFNLAIGVKSLTNIIDTLISRSWVHQAMPTSFLDKRTHYSNMNYDVIDEKIFIKVAKSKAMMDEIYPKFNETYEYALRVFDNILNVTTGNSFKIGNNIAFKVDEPGIDLELFLQCYKHIALKYGEVEMVQPTLIALNKIVRRGVIKKLIFDVWVLDIRKLR